MSSDHSVSMSPFSPLVLQFPPCYTWRVLETLFTGRTCLCVLDGIGRRNYCSVVGTTVPPSIFGPSDAFLQS
jgi:hypothetical protein